MIGLGMQEMIVLALLGIMLFGLPLTILFVFLFVYRRKQVRLSELESEVIRLNDEVAELKKTKA